MLHWVPRFFVPFNLEHTFNVEHTHRRRVDLVEAVEEWWDANMAPLVDADSDRALLEALIEELHPTLLLAKIFVRVSKY